MREISIDEIGKVVFVKSKRARNICISVRPLHGVKVTVPGFVSYAEAERVVYQKTEWIKKHINKIKEIEKSNTKFTGGEGEGTRFHKLFINEKLGGNVSVRVCNKKIIVAYPTHFNVESEIVQSAVRKGIERAIKIEAKEYLPVRVNELAGRFGLKYENVTVKNVKSRWGSCSRRKNINLNIHLMRLPDHLIDYVILHELAHTVELNHSKRFWSLLDSLTGNSKQLDKELKNYRISTY